jgi:aspartyl-tRNA(Asn)/glutamyl-tRNA(Gln) amidotransferase subunit C
MATDPVDVRSLAELARLELSPDECVRFQPQLDAILKMAESLSQLDVEGIEPTAHPLPLHDVMREDLPRPGLAVAAVLENAPDHSQDQVRVPKVIADA